MATCNKMSCRQCPFCNGTGMVGFNTIEADKKIIKPEVSNEIVIYTDGSCVSEYGGWGAVIINSGEISYHNGPVFEHPTTNNRSELSAILEALKIVPSGYNITIYSDSQYSIKALTVWRYNWEKKGWKTANGKDVKNKDLIDQIVPHLQLNVVKFLHVKAHNGDIYNEKADRLANEGRIKQL